MLEFISTQSDIDILQSLIFTVAINQLGFAAGILAHISIFVSSILEKQAPQEPVWLHVIVTSLHRAEKAHHDVSKYVLRRTKSEDTSEYIASIT